MIHRTAFIALAGFLLALGVALGQTVTLHKVEQDDPQVAFTHPMGFVFPAEVNGMPRGDIIRYDADGKDIGSTYKHASPSITATVYVYPNPAPKGKLESYFKQTAEEIASLPGIRHIKTEGATIVGEFPAGQGGTDMKLLDTKKMAIALGKKKSEGYRALFSVSKPHSLARNGEAVSEYYLFPLTESWLLKFRITYLAEDKEQAAPVIEKFLNGFAWPEKKSGSIK